MHLPLLSLLSSDLSRFHKKSTFAKGNSTKGKNKEGREYV